MRRTAAWAALAAAGLATVLGWLFWAQLPGHGLLSPRAPATGDAEWIWLPGPATRRSAVAFYAVRDLRLEAAPWAAELIVAADEEYVAWVNGRRIGGGAFAPGAPLDRYHVGTALRPGDNRLVIEVRSARGAGGLLACLRDPESGRVLAASGPNWRILGHHAEALFGGHAPLDDTVPAVSWGLPPAGRWGSPPLGPLRPPGFGAGAPIPPWRTRPLERPARWRPVFHGANVPPHGRGPSGVLLDFGRPVTGRLELRLAAVPRQRSALLFFGLDPVNPIAGTPAGRWNGGAGPRRPDGAVILLQGRRDWVDARVRRFRYAAVLGARPVVAAWVAPPSPAEPAPERAAASEDGRPRGLLGIEPPPLRAPIEDEVRRQLERLPGGAGR